MSLRKLFFYYSISFFCMVTTGYTHAQNSPFTTNPFTVYALQADRISENATQARILALNEVQQQAFNILLQRFTHREVSALPSPTSQQIEELILSLEILTENLSSVRYIATLNIHFNPQKVREFFRTASLTFFDPPTLPFLVIPVVQRSNQTLLWSQWTPWRQAWEKYTAQNSFIPFFLPNGDLNDIRLINAQQALNEEHSSLANVLKHYNTNSILIATLNLTNPNNVSIAHYEYRNLIKRYTFPYQPENRENIIENFLQTLTSDWKEDIFNGHRGLNPTTQTITTPVTDFQHFIQILLTFDREQRIIAYTVDSLTSKRATFTITYQGQLFYLYYGIFDFLDISPL